MLNLTELFQSFRICSKFLFCQQTCSSELHLRISTCPSAAMTQERFTLRYSKRCAEKTGDEGSAVGGVWECEVHSWGLKQQLDGWRMIVP